MEPFVMDQKLPVLRLPFFETKLLGLAAGFTVRQGGISRPPFHSMNCGLHVGDRDDLVVENRRHLCSQLGFPFESWTCAEQVHSNQIHYVTTGERGKGRLLLKDVIKGADGIITTEKNILLTSLYADCVPLLFLSAEHHAVGLAHAGWRGTVTNIAGEMVRAFHQFDHIRPEQLYAVIGPSIGACCYEVDDRVAKPLQSLIADSGKVLTQKGNGKYMADLKEANKLLLLQAGIQPENIYVSSWCTSCHTDLFFSHRREGGKTGRMASFIGMRNEG